MDYSLEVYDLEEERLAYGNKVQFPKGVKCIRWCPHNLDLQIAIIKNGKSHNMLKVFRRTE
jgi:hypothetical protein